jgi:hypothetical protein
MTYNGEIKHIKLTQSKTLNDGDYHSITTAEKVL